MCGGGGGSGGGSDGGIMCPHVCVKQKANVDLKQSYNYHLNTAYSPFIRNLQTRRLNLKAMAMLMLGLRK